MVSTGSLAIVSVYSRRGDQSFTLQYRLCTTLFTHRIVDTMFVLADSPGASPGGGGACTDLASNCVQNSGLCNNAAYLQLMRTNCARTCGTCGSNNSPVSGGSSNCVDGSAK